MFNSQIKSAPLPERLYELENHCARLSLCYMDNYSAGNAQTEGADHNACCMPTRQNILLKNGAVLAVRKAKKSAGGSVPVIPYEFNGVTTGYCCAPVPAGAQGAQEVDVVFLCLCGNGKGLLSLYFRKQLFLMKASIGNFVGRSDVLSGASEAVAWQAFLRGGLTPLFLHVVICVPSLGWCRSSSHHGVDGDYSCCSLDLRRSSPRATATSLVISSAALAPIFSTCASASSEETSGFSLLPSVWRRAISPRMAVTINPALLSVPCLTDSIPSMTSWGTRTVVNCDLAFLLVVAIAETPYIWCVSVYRNREIQKVLTCVSLVNNVKHTSDSLVIQMTKPGSAGTLTGLLTKPLSEVTIMAGTQHTQTHPKYQYRFLALSATGRNVIHITASTEREARNRCPSGCVAVFAGRLPVPEVRHA